MTEYTVDDIHNSYKKKFYLLPEDIQRSIAPAFINGESLTSISTRLGIHRQTVTYAVRKSGIPTNRNNQRVCGLNDTAFSEITPESAYWTGFLMADGNVFGNSVSLTLSSVDCEHVKKFRAFVGYSGNMEFFQATRTFPKRRNYTTTSDMCRIQFRSRIIADDLSKHGVIPNKSLVAKVIGLENNRDFWRGIIDGDGCISTMKVAKYHTQRTYPVLKITGSKFIVQQFIDFCKIYCPQVRATPAASKTSNCYSATFTHRIAIKMIEVLYTDATIALDRKMTKATEAMDSWKAMHSQKLLRIRGLRKRSKVSNLTS